MEVRTLGRTALGVSRIGLGLAALGRPGYINLGHASDLAGNLDVAAMETHAFGVLDAAFSAGVRYFDAARSYGKAEEFLAHWLVARGLERQAVTVGSKWGYTYTAGWSVQAEQHEVKDHSVANLVRQAQETRAVLGTHLDLYQIHSATPESGVLEDQQVCEELARLRDSGLAIGLSLSGPRQAEMITRASEIEVGGQPLFSTVQATWNLLEPSAGRALADAHDQGIGVIIKEALANGRLTDRNTDPAFVTRSRVLKELAHEREVTLDALALAAVLNQHWADVVLSGAATIEQLQSNLAAVDVPWNESLQFPLESLAEAPDAYWRYRSRMPWN
jgi:aryl-alcohol dehydrogenase-like predicted oxidoreductase